jgi:hypothetical protein
MPCTRWSPDRVSGGFARLTRLASDTVWSKSAGLSQNVVCTPPVPPLEQAASPAGTAKGGAW